MSDVLIVPSDAKAIFIRLEGDMRWTPQELTEFCDNVKKNCGLSIILLQDANVVGYVGANDGI